MDQGQNIIGERREPLTRRQLLQRGAAGAVMVGAGTWLSACGSSSSAPAKAAAGKPQHGGTLHAGLTGGSSADTLDADNAITNMDFGRVNNLYEPLIYMNAQALPELWLAEEITPNSTATAWAIRVRPDITFHNGKTLGADDVIFTFQRILNPKKPLEGATPLAAVDVGGMKKLDARTVLVPCKTPFATLPEVLSIWYYLIVPTGYDLHNPVGTGPFRYQSFTPGVQSVFTRYGDYWRHPLPYLDKVIISNFSDETSQVNALASRAANVVNLLSADSMATVTSSGARLLISPGGGFTPFTMRVDVPPFNDVRVRQAMRLLVDRRQMMELVFAGHGTLGNDVFGIWAPEYDRSLPQREQDVAQAKSLLRAAGQDGLTVQLVTGDIGQGTLQAAQVFAQQAKSAGVTVNLRQVTVTDFYGSNYLKWGFAQDFWYYNYYLPQVAAATLPTAPFNETHFDNARYNMLYSQALRTLDRGARYQIAHEMMQIDYEQGGMIIPYFPPVIDAFAGNVHGFVPSKTGLSLNSYNFSEVWIGS
jgi:peptide/nickel transport system substrate-binding protein